MGGKVHAYVVLFVRVHARMQARICVCMCTGVVAVTAQHFFLHKSLYIIKDAKGSDIHATGHLSVCVCCVCASICRHEVQAMAIDDPVSGRAALLLLQTDITKRAVLEARMAALTERQLGMLEKMFPRWARQGMNRSGGGGGMVKQFREHGYQPWEVKPVLVLAERQLDILGMMQAG